MKEKSTKILLFLFVICFITPDIISANGNISQTSEDKMVLNPNLFGVQFEFTTMLFSYEYGGHLDFDILKSRNKEYGFGTRISFERYHAGTVGGSIIGSPFTNYNIFLRQSFRGSVLWFDVLGGFTYYTTSAAEYYPNELLFRAGFELSYHFLYDIIGLTLKSSTSFKEKTGYLGLGLTIGFYKN